MKKKLFAGLVLASTLLVACQSTPATPAATRDNKLTTTSTTTMTKSPQTEAPKPGDTIAVLDTDKGVIKIKLFTDLAPETTKNFIELAKAGNYDGVPFHRVIIDFMIQTGDFTNRNGTGGHSYKGPGTTINDEFSPELKNLKGTVSMANSGPNTNGSQFFIVTANEGTPWLNNKHSVFGQVYEGQDVADAISKVSRNVMDAPLEPVTIKSVTISTL